MEFFPALEDRKPSLLRIFLCASSVLLLLAGMLGLFTLLPYLRVRALTAAHAGEFEGYVESSGLLRGEEAEIRVLRYRRGSAKVSFLSKSGKESVCTFLRAERAPEKVGDMGAKAPNWVLDSRRIVRNADSGLFSGILRSYLRMIGC